MRDLIWVSFAVLYGVLLPVEFTLGQEARRESDTHSLHQLFGEVHLAANTLRVCDDASRQSEELRYRRLAEWVLPGEERPTFRVIGDFGITQKVPAAGESLKRVSKEVLLERLIQNERLKSPAVELVKTARSLDRLDELRDRILSSQPKTNEALRPQLTLLFLVEIASEDFESARTVFEEFVEASVDVDRSRLVTRWCEFLILNAGLQAPECRKMVGDFYFNLYRDPEAAREDSQLAAVSDYIRVLQGVYQSLELTPSWEPPVESGDLQSEWIPYSLTTASSRGVGRPDAYWETSAGRVFRITGHETDYLSYRVPLRGNFQVECDAHAGSSRSLSLMVAGTYAQMHDDTSRILAGTFGSAPVVVDLEPRLSSYREVTRLRATVQDGVLTQYINGRPVLTKELPANHDSWIAIRTGDRSLGVITDMRITGEPIVPEEIQLITGPGLEGWAAYHQPDSSDWRVIENEVGEMELICPRRPSLDGAFAENLLYYHRPIAEDGTIEYDFFYSEGESSVSPALGRMALLLTPEGVKLHNMTDGKYDRTALSPDNAVPIVRTNAEPQPLPLADNDWNRIRLTITGDELELYLNGSSIHRQKLDVANHRTFGLFHYQDYTRARVRKMVWRGNWPNEIPPVLEQKLASRELQFLEDTASALTEVFEHDFTEHDSPFDRFRVLEGEADHFEQLAEGLLVVRPFANGYDNSTISPRVRLSGDFDITACFDRFKPHPCDGSSNGIFLQAAIENEHWEQVRIHRRLENSKVPPRSVMRCSVINQRGGKNQHAGFEMVVEESTSGQFRLSRRGKTIYLLFAEADSPNFRLFGVHETTTDDVFEIHLGVQSRHESVTEVVWRKLTIRAREMHRPEEYVEQLNAERDQLTKNFEYDFDVNTFPLAAFRPSGAVISADEKTRIEAPGGTGSFGPKVMSRFGVMGDFDVEFQFSDVVYAEPDDGESSSIYLQIEVPDLKQTQANIIFSEDSKGRRSAYIQLREIDERGKSVYRRIHTEKFSEDDFHRLDKLRIARRGKTLTYLYHLKNAEQDVAVMQMEYFDLPLPVYYIRLMLHSGGSGKTSSLRLKEFKIHAENLSPDPKVLQPQPIDEE